MNNLNILTKSLIIVIGILALFFAGCKPEDKTPAFIYATYSVLSRLVPEEMDVEYQKDYDFIYIQAMPHWKETDFDKPIETIIDSMVDKHQYERQEIFTTFIETVHRAGSKLLISFSGGRFINVAKDPVRRHRFAVYMASFAKKHNYDGLELDWEGTVTKELHLEMIKALRAELDSLEKLDRRRYWLTTALNCEHNYSAEEASKLSASLDWINIMYYDMGGGYWGNKATHNAPLNVIKDNYETNWSRFDRKQIHIGLANYGYYYEGICPEMELPSGDKLSKHGSRDFFMSELPDLQKAGWKEIWDEKACCPYYLSPEWGEIDPLKVQAAPEKSAFVSAENQRSIDMKVQWAREMGFGGVFWWEFHCDWISNQDGGGRHILHI